MFGTIYLAIENKENTLMKNGKVFSKKWILVIVSMVGLSTSLFASGIFDDTSTAKSSGITQQFNVGGGITKTGELVTYAKKRYHSSQAGWGTGVEVQIIYRNWDSNEWKAWQNWDIISDFDWLLKDKNKDENEIHTFDSGSYFYLFDTSKQPYGEDGWVYYDYAVYKLR
jgi:hypothetical protein